jgi:FkbM family methyltransferase
MLGKRVEKNPSSCGAVNKGARSTAVWILAGNLRGKRWIVESGIHRYWLGFYEREKQRCISRAVRPGSVFWDVGANVGFYSLLASELVGSGRVYAFEPVPRNLAFLAKHLALNHVTNVEVLALAVSDTNGVFSFETEDSGFMGHLADHGTLMVPTATLDSLVEGHQILPPHYVKMDIEGAELLALDGASQTFQLHHPTLFLATHGRDVHQACRQLLESWGYECKMIPGTFLEDRAEVLAKFVL